MRERGPKGGLGAVCVGAVTWGRDEDVIAEGCVINAR